MLVPPQTPIHAVPPKRRCCTSYRCVPAINSILSSYHGLAGTAKWCVRRINVRSTQDARRCASEHAAAGMFKAGKKVRILNDLWPCSTAESNALTIQVALWSKGYCSGGPWTSLFPRLRSVRHELPLRGRALYVPPASAAKNNAACCSPQNGQTFARVVGFSCVFVIVTHGELSRAGRS
jgi:hypothetical protein